MSIILDLIANEFHIEFKSRYFMVFEIQLNEIRFENTLNLLFFDITFELD